jgi:hypothetical protein
MAGDRGGKGKIILMASYPRRFGESVVEVVADAVLVVTAWMVIRGGP